MGLLSSQEIFGTKCRLDHKYFIPALFNPSVPDPTEEARQSSQTIENAQNY